MNVHSISCILCGKDETDVVEEDEPPFRVVRCRHCGLIYVNPQPPQQELAEHYSKETYYEEWTTVQAKERISLWNRRLKDVQKYKKTGRLLDIGCGEGTFLKMAHDKGWEVQGTEISLYACHYAKEQYGLDVFRGDVKDKKFEEDFFDVVTVWHVLEHLTDPLATLRGVRRILKPDGILILETPNVNNYLFKAIYFLVKWKKERFFSLSDKEKHLFHFSTTTLLNVLQKAGFRAIESTLKPVEVSWPKKLIENLSLAIFYLTRVNIGQTLRIHAKKN